MNNHCLPGRTLYTAVFFLSSALVVLSADNSVGVGMARAQVSAPASTTALASDAAVLPTKEAPPAADNTGRNTRDRDGRTLTPWDQSNDPDDVKITRKIRKALVGDDALSTTAKNIKIITVHGKVVLRGPVANVQEKKKIGKTAQKFTKQHVENQLEVATR